MKLRKATSSDYDSVWDIFSQVIQTADTYVFDPYTPKDDLQKHWFASYMQTFVVEENGEILGTYIIKPNQIDLGNHIANCSYMVSTKAQGKGVGKMLCEHSIQTAIQTGYLGIQFNIVVSTNTVAVALWKKFGFEIIGTTPGGFRHAKLGMVDTYIMFKDLKE
ncbi:GNAT family N-acetyltransferase [Algoriphagus vanfongensis]|uniref:GNAT family N-acetyltransferase n=1 Tax=Algoriphagus vanfongensis TaxID=426371 RepID=UPI0003FA8120|nr:GNAT family N-acetyltransferase [Algoriphagus vanfongensis]